MADDAPVGAASASPRVRVGTSGYSYDDWVGPVYPQGSTRQDFLSLYSREFSIVELNFSYYQQADWYLDGVRALSLSADPAFVFIFQEKTPPYLITPVQLDADALTAGREVNREAINLYRACTERGEWPGYTAGIEVISLPPWAFRRLEEF